MFHLNKSLQKFVKNKSQDFLPTLTAICYINHIHVMLMFTFTFFTLFMTFTISKDSNEPETISVLFQAGLSNHLNVHVCLIHQLEKCP